MTRCYLCGGKVVPGKVTAENWWGNDLAIVEDVPAMVCEQCGETYFDADTVKQLDKLRQSSPKARRKVQVPVYSYPGSN